VLDKMIPIKRKTGIRAKGDLDPILHASPRARLIPEEVMIVTPVKLLKTLVPPQANIAEFVVNYQL